MAERAARPIIATGFVADTPETASEFPSVGSDSSDPAFQAVYWRCIAVFFYGHRLNNPGTEAVLFSNVGPPAVDGVDLPALFERIGVTVVTLPLTRRLAGEGASRRWGSVFYVLDVIAWMERHRANARFALFDSDVAVTAPLDALFDALSTHPFAAYRMTYPADHSVNGLTPGEAAAIVARLAPGFSAPTIPFYGGELLGLNLELAKPYLPQIERLWAFAIEQGGILTEEHFWSVFFALHQVPVATDHGAIKRIATYFRFNTAAAGDELVPAWHLPAEKRLGFVTMFRVLAERGFSLDISPDAHRREAQAHFGIPRAGLGKRLRDTAWRVRRKFRAIGTPDR